VQSSNHCKHQLSLIRSTPINDYYTTRYTKSQVHVGYISAIWGADPIGPISTKIAKVVGVLDVIIHSNFGFNIFRGFRSTGGQNFRHPIEFAGHRYNSAAATAQPVMAAG